MSIEQAIDDRIGEVRFDALDLSFGEIQNLHQNDEIIIDPAYQRLFRWSDEQKSKLIESILLGLPLPQIFFIENDEGVLELIDGLQRISSVLQFFDGGQIGRENLTLDGCDLITELNGQTIGTLDLSLKLRLRRSAIRSVIIKRQSKGFLKYEMFKRLNTGGSVLSAQEIRNCSLRMIDGGSDLYNHIQNMASIDEFQRTISTMSESDREQKGDEELVLRYLALKNGRNHFKGSVRDWLDRYTEEIILGDEPYPFGNEILTFHRVFHILDQIFGDAAFVKYRDGRPIGALAPAYFEAVTMGALNNLETLAQADRNVVRESVIAALESQQFRAQTGPGANSRPKLEKRIEIISDAMSI